MDHQDIRTLRLLEEIEKNESPSQRQIASRLNISLGLANSFIKRLAQKGYLKITTIPKNRIKYILTPKGATEKTRLTYEFIRYSFKFYKETRQKLKKIFSRFEKEGVLKIAFYGAGELAEIAYISLQETEMSLVTVFDEVKNGKKFFGRSIENPNNWSDFEFDRILVTVSENAASIRSKLIEKGLSPEKIVFLQ